MARETFALDCFTNGFAERLIVYAEPVFWSNLNFWFIHLSNLVGGQLAECHLGESVIWPIDRLAENFGEWKYYFNMFYLLLTDCAELNAPIPASNSSGSAQSRPNDTNHSEGVTRNRSQNLCVPRNRIHSRYCLSKSINHKTENWFEPVRQRFPRFVQTDRFWSVSLVYASQNHFFTSPHIH